jgi:hypothetical protein
MIYCFHYYLEIEFGLKADYAGTITAFLFLIRNCTSSKRVFFFQQDVENESSVNNAGSSAGFSETAL